MTREWGYFNDHIKGEYKKMEGSLKGGGSLPSTHYVYIKTRTITQSTLTLRAQRHEFQ